MEKGCKGKAKRAKRQKNNNKDKMEWVTRVCACVCQCRVLLCDKRKIKTFFAYIRSHMYVWCVCMHEMMTKPQQLMHVMIKWRQYASCTETQRHKLICYNILCSTILLYAKASSLSFSTCICIGLANGEKHKWERQESKNECRNFQNKEWKIH